MRFPKPKSAPGAFLYTLSAIVLALVARVLWLVVDQNVESLSSAKGLDKLLPRYWPIFLIWLGENAFWLVFLAAFALGGALSVWAYVVLADRERDSVHPKQEAREWLTVLEARAQFLGPEIEQLITKSAGAAEARARTRGVTQWAAASDPDNIEAANAMFDADNEWLDAQRDFEAHSIAARNKLVSLLADGTLIATGLPKADGIAQPEDQIPQEFWRFLNLDWTTDQAAGEGRCYVGVRISKPGELRGHGISGTQY
ncbi:hypothetical protein [Phenylobacterium sp.]|uniref:hypothetical protein n=1 Tax=Phenylobacterium sp. TaxID=1871053 RepID=UPI002732DB6F|nr:hypothetical protein [Phenylobacterium sp.]MDP3854067.1 hypothetical protein [Phenylobacterium sp.]